MTETTTPGNKILPNSFQTPNFFVDECMPLLTGNEYKCLSFVARKTFGWQKRSDCIAKSQIAAATGMNQETVDRCMNALMGFGLVLRVADNNPRQNNGVEWALQTNDELIRFDLLEARLEKQSGKCASRMEKARENRKARRGGAVDEQPGGGMDGGTVDEQPGGGGYGQPGGTVDEQGTQKPIKTKEKMGAAALVSPVEEKTGNVTGNVGANAPETSGETSDLIEARITAFPEETHETVRLMLELFGVRPPERPAAHEKGGDYALWVKGIRELQKIAADYETPLKKALWLTCQRWQNKPFDVSHPGALKKSLTSVLAQQARAQTQTETLDNPTEETSTGPATLPSEELRARMAALRKQRKN